MKKSFFSLMAVLVMGSLCFTSCNKNDQKEDSTPESETPVDVNFVVAIAENQLKYFEQTFELDVNGKTVKFSVSDMNKVNDKSKYASMKLKVDNTKYVSNYDMYDYKLGSLSKGQSVASKSLSFKLLSDRPKDNSLDYLSAWEVFNVSGTEPVMLTKSNYLMYVGVKDSILNDFIEGASEFFDFKVTY